MYDQNCLIQKLVMSNNEIVISGINNILIFLNLMKHIRINIICTIITINQLFLNVVLININENEIIKDLLNTS